MTDESKFMSRKFILTCLILLAALGLFIAGRISAELWSDQTKWIVGLYFAGNVGTWLAEAIKGK